MNLDDLQKQWAAYDRKLDASLKLNQRAVREAAFAKVRRSLFWHKAFIAVEILFGVWFLGMLGSFAVDHWGTWKFVAPAVALYAWTLASIVFVTHELVALLRVDYGQPILAIQRELETRRLARIRFTKWILLTGIAIWVLWLVVGLKGLFGFDAYAGGGTVFVLANLLFGAALIAVYVVVSRMNAERIARSTLLRKISDSFAGDALPAAMAHLDELARFEDTVDIAAAQTATPASSPTTAPHQAASRSSGGFSMLKYSAVVVGAIAVLLLALGVGLPLSPEPEFDTKLPAIAGMRLPPDQGHCAEADAANGSGAAAIVKKCLAMRDGTLLGATRYASSAPGAPLIVMTHGFVVDSRALDPAARALRAKTGAEVWTLDLRGHGRSGGRVGDIDYLGQYEDDIADAIGRIRAVKPDGKLILAGHAIGGGMAMRYAQLPAAPGGAPRVDGYLLYAPHLGHGSPTNQANALEPAKGKTEPTIKLHTRRLIGLLMLNAVGIHAFDHLPTLFFNLPPGAGVDRYSFRATRSIGPEDYRAALTADAKPMLVIVGSRDPFSLPAAFPDVVALHRNGTSLIVDGAGSMDVMTRAESLDAVKQWLDGAAFAGGAQ